MQSKSSEVNRSSMRSGRFVPVSDILPRISATVIVLNYKAMLSTEQLSVLCNGKRGGSASPDSTFGRYWGRGKGDRQCTSADAAVYRVLRRGRHSGSIILGSRVVQ